MKRQKKDFPDTSAKRDLLACQRFWWKGMYLGAHVMRAWHSFVDDNGNKMDTIL